ncbi:muramoyltetrapeptide carboxypeptidase [Chryseobacterium sp. SLBN-27]|uniref:S66 peptidase family protein n=1 Tax=Chryseobacterium sp. SLBN-27 TaxID=3042287 RepID=UPI00285F4700|nr:LD-carboxypeptidase [Chryseobacterium sp. SLBN-27]MDR6159403.1 muramoyltetrapeptide carboxypeptidase [Chryseobacterium sp. SLBN-27]
MKKIIFPKSLKKGDKIAIISPAGAVEAAQLEKGIEMIRHKGYVAVLGEHLYGSFSKGYHYAGTEEQRMQDLNLAFNDNEIAAIWASRGGYGCQHLLENIDLKNFTDNPKWYIGYSDNTVIQSYLLKKGFASIHGQTVKTSSFGVTEESYELIFDILEGRIPDYNLKSHHFNKTGSCEGQLVGGNLALVYALLGTNYSFKFKNRILFIEDIGENFYALDRMMMSLELAGIFKKIKGLIIGGMTNMANEKENTAYNESFDEFAYQLISERISKYDFPVVFGFPNGHIKDNRPLIIGGNIKLEVSASVKIEFEN